MVVCPLQRAVFFTFAVVHTVGVQADCYSRDGVAFKFRYQKYDELVSCGNGTNNCCVLGDECGTNLLCTQAGGVGRQYCAVKDWTNCSQMAPEVIDSGTGLIDCGENVYCNGVDNTCCTDGSASYVNPLTGEVKDVNSKDNDATRTASYWKVDSIGILASMRTASLSQTVETSSTTTSSSAQPTSSESRTAASTPTPTSTSTSNESNQSSGGISAGAGAGIGIGATAGVVIIAVLAWLFFRERKKRRALQAQGLVHESAMDTSMQQPQGTWKGPATEYYAHEAPPDSGHTELDEERARYEMDHERARQEMP